MVTLEERLVTSLAAWRQAVDSGLPERKRAAHLLGAHYRGLGRWDEALALFRLVRDECAAADDLDGVNEFDTWLSNLHYHMGDYARAIDLIRAVIERESAVDVCRAAETGAYYLAKPLFITDQLEEHRAVVARAVETFRAKRPPHADQRLPWFLTELANNWLETGRAAEAVALAAEQVAVFRATASTSGIPHALMVHGFAAVAAGWPELAEASLAEALGLYRTSGREAFVCDCLIGLSRAAVLAGDLPLAQARAAEALAEARLGPRRTEGLADTIHLNVLVQVYLAEKLVGNLAAAGAAFEESRGLAQRHGRQLILRHLSEAEGTAPQS